MHRLRLHQLRFFVEVASAGTFTEAAERLGRSQPAVSMQIRSLEKEVGRPLGEPSYRRLHLSPLGRALLHVPPAGLSGARGWRNAW